MSQHREPPSRASSALTTQIVSGELLTVDSVRDASGEADPAAGGEDSPQVTVEVAVLPGSPQHGLAGETLASATARERAPTAGLPTMTAGRFVGVRTIGAGGMGSVKLLFDRVLRRSVAQKTMQSGLLDRPGFAMRFIEEAQITSQLDHPNVAPAYDLCLSENGQDIVFLMKPVVGETLTRVARRAHREPFSSDTLERLLRIFVKVCDGVSFAHSRGVLHLDLKPDNIMVGSHGQVYVMDWGVARLLGGGRPSECEAGADAGPPVRTSRQPGDGEPTVAGSPAYLSPEQARAEAERLSERSDVYGLGAILYYLLAARGPTYRDEARLALEAAKRGSVIPVQEVGAWEELPPALCEIVARALRTEPSERYASAEDLKAEVETFLRGGGWFSRKRYLAGEIILKEGEAADSAYIVVSGRCEISREVAGTRDVIRTVGPQEIFGETAVLTDSPRSATVRAETDVECLVITQAALAREFERSDWLRILVEGLAHRFREADSRVAEAARAQSGSGDSDP